MNDGVHTPEQAARSLRVVRLVSFGASAVLAALTLLGLAWLRYPLEWTPSRATAPVLVVTEEARPIPVERPPRLTRPPAPQAIDAPVADEVPHAMAGTSEPVVITTPVWIERPRNPERFYPREAFMQGVAGEVVLDCDVGVDGRLTCVVASESPPEQGFGEAALRIAGAHVMRPAMRNGTAVRGRYRMIVPFSPGG